MSENIQIRLATVGKWKENSYQICYKNASWLIDPGDDFNRLNTVFDTNNIYGILSTHGHFDHIGAVSEFQNNYNLDFYLHSKDKRVLSQANLHRKIVGDNKISKTPIINYYLDDIKSLPFLDKQIKVHHFPGHTEGSVGFELDNNLFTGDLFFFNGLVRNDLPGGNQKKLIDSLDFVIHNFANFIIYPGHGKYFVLNSTLILRFKEIIYEYRHRSN